MINATGIFCDDLRRMDEPGAKPMLAVSQGSHFVLPRHFLPGDAALMIPKTSDGRVLFAIPWHDRVVVGTTDNPVPIRVRAPCNAGRVQLWLTNYRTFSSLPKLR